MGSFLAATVGWFTARTQTVGFGSFKQGDPREKSVYGDKTHWCFAVALLFLCIGMGLNFNGGSVCGYVTGGLAGILTIVTIETAFRGHINDVIKHKNSVEDWESFKKVKSIFEEYYKPDESFDPDEAIQQAYGDAPPDSEEFERLRVHLLGMAAEASANRDKSESQDLYSGEDDSVNSKRSETDRRRLSRRISPVLQCLLPEIQQQE